MICKQKNGVIIPHRDMCTSLFLTRILVKQQIHSGKICQLFGKVRAHGCALVRSTLVGQVHTRDHELRQLTGFLKGLRKPSLAPFIPPASHISYIHIPGTLIFLVVNLLFLH